ncbi:MAG TPA: cyanophycin synthetase, partial [Alphaproteobacteria bacterium]
AAASALGISVAHSCGYLKDFKGIKRRMDVVGQANGITVIDDFAHNPDKIAATLSALKQFPGRLIVIFQMHGYGPLKLMWRDLADSFAQNLGPDDRILTMDPLYLGGTVDKSLGMQQVVESIGARATWHESRKAAGQEALKLAKPGDRIIVMGARDDTLSEFAEWLLRAILK